MELKTLPQALEAIAALTVRIETLEKAAAEKRDRGPASEREMMNADAYRVKFGDLANTKHAECAKILGLSYGQVYSARGDYTFKQVKKDWLDAPANKTALEAATKEHPVAAPAAAQPVTQQ